MAAGVHYKPKRAITEEEHHRIVEREKNPEWKAFYQLCWHLGGSQSDMATLCAEDIDWCTGTLSFTRNKTSVAVAISLAGEVQSLGQSRKTHRVSQSLYSHGTSN